MSSSNRIVPRLTRSETVPRPRSQQTRRHAKQSRQGRTVAAAADERAKLEQEYTFHSPGSVQETDDAVVFAHQTPGEAGKWKDASVFHVGDGSSDPVRLGVVIGEFHNVLMDRMLEDARVSAEAMGGRVDQVVWVPGTYEAPLVVERMLEDDALDAVCVVGYIEKGSTLHGQEMGSTCSLIFKQLELEHGKPVGHGHHRAGRHRGAGGGARGVRRQRDPRLHPHGQVHGQEVTSPVVRINITLNAECRSQPSRR